MTTFLRPRWILSHLFVVALVVTMVNLGFWQLRRLDERRAANDLVEQRSQSEPVAFDAVEGIASGAGPSDDDEYRRVTITGTFESGSDVFVANRNLDGQPGSWVLTPLIGRDGAAVIVNRGFVPRSVVLDPALAGYAPPSGTVEVEGRLRTSATNGLAGDTSAGESPEISVADIGLVGELTGLAVADAYVEATSITPPPATELPLTLPGPAPGDGPHLAYAMQWFVFSTIGVVGYALVLRRIARGDESRGDVAPDWEL